MGRWIGGHVDFEKLAGYLCQWQPVQTRVVHYAGESDAGGDHGPTYRSLLAEGRRIHPRWGPTSLWEFTHAMQEHLHGLGYPAPSTVRAGQPGEVLTVWPRFA